jgi:hypothetical protein
VIWARRIVVLVPFAFAATLNTLAALARPMHWRSEHLAGYCFLFMTPWAWLLDRGWVGTTQSKVLNSIFAALLILWIPALLYSVSLWLILRFVRLCSAHPQ